MLLVFAACRLREGEELALVGTVERTLVEVSAPVSETIVEIAVVRGQSVQEGQLLARLDPTLAHSDVAHAEATLAGARTGIVTADHDLDRITRLHHTRVASAQDLERAQLARDEAAARLREAEASLASAEKRRADLVLASPVAGVVDQIPFDRGERPPAGGVVVVVLDQAAPWVRVWVPETAVSRVRPGTAAHVRIDGLAGSLPGHVLDVAHEPEFTPHFALTQRDRVHLVYETRVQLDGAPADLRPGLPAEVTLVPGAEAQAGTASP